MLGTPPSLVLVRLMERNRHSQISGAFPQTSRPWLRWCSAVTLVISIGFLCISLFAYGYHPVSGTSLVPLTLVATLIFATSLNVYSLWRFSNEHRAIDQAFATPTASFRRSSETCLTEF